MDRHEIPDEDVEYAIEWIAKEYNKQDGAWLAYMSCLNPHAGSRRTDEGLIRRTPTRI